MSEAAGAGDVVSAGTGDSDTVEIADDAAVAEKPGAPLLAGLLAGPLVALLAGPLVAPTAFPAPEAEQPPASRQIPSNTAPARKGLTNLEGTSSRLSCRRRVPRPEGHGTPRCARRSCLAIMRAAPQLVADRPHEHLHPAGNSGRPRQRRR
ncbi:MAG: hypothetical protein ACRDNW_04155 [Trebonia sp.]